MKQVVEFEASITYPFGVCGHPVEDEVRADCDFGCGRVFQKGYYQARHALGDGQSCAICGSKPA